MSHRGAVLLLSAVLCLTAVGSACGAVRTSEKTSSETAMDALENAREALGQGREESAAVTLTPTPTPVPELTVVPGTKESEQKDAEIPKPEHPDTYTNDRLIFVGDSRTVAMRDAVHDDSFWSCKVGAGYDWMTTTGVPNLEPDITDNTAIIFWFGVNDPYNVANYINYVNYKANEWAGLGAKVYYVSVGPVSGDPYVSNAQIEAFNTSLQVSLTGVTYIDIYTYLTENGYSTLDGTHYPDNVSIAIYNYILSHLEETRSGIWG